MTATTLSLNDWLTQVARRAYSTAATLRATYDLTRATLAAGTLGDLVECGVAQGVQCAAMARAIMDAGADRRVHLFDSFEGIPKCGEHDLEFLEANHPAGLTAHSLESVKRHMAEWGIPDDMLVYHPGWFAETVPMWAASKPQIAMLRLDGDIYESTKVCMDHLYPLVPKGAWVIVDDYHLSGCRKAVNEHVVPGPVYFVRNW